MSQYIVVATQIRTAAMGELSMCDTGSFADQSGATNTTDAAAPSS